MKALRFLLFLVIPGLIAANASNNPDDVSLLAAGPTDSTRVPVITGFTPKSGPVGTVVTILGNNFDSTIAKTIVCFGSISATIQSSQPTAIVATVPRGAGYEAIRVTVAGLTACSNLPFNITFASDSISAALFPKSVNYGAELWPNGMTAGDLDGDGFQDVVVANAHSNSISVFLNSGTPGGISAATFAPPVSFATGAFPNNIAISDLDGDAKPDIVVANFNAGTISILRNAFVKGSLTTGSFEQRIDLLAGTNPTVPAVGDLDMDGKPDIAVTNYVSGTVSVYRNVHQGGSLAVTSFSAKIDLLTGSFPNGLTIRDLNGDLWPEIAVTNSYTNSVQIFRNKGIGGELTSSSFGPRSDFPTGSYPISIVSADLDGDGLVDLATANFNGNSISLLRNVSPPDSQASILFAPKIDLSTAIGPYSLEASDLNGDGKPDIAATNSTTRTVSLFQNSTSTGAFTNNSFSPKRDLPTGAFPHTVKSSDVDCDGKPDLLVTNLESGTFSVYRNLGNRRLDPPRDLTAIPGNTMITLTWRSSSERDILGYRIYRHSFPPASVLVDSATNGPDDTTRIQSGLTNGQTYLFRVTSVDSGGYESGFSHEVVAAPQSTPNPIDVPVITSIRDVPNDNGKQVFVTWKLFRPAASHGIARFSLRSWNRTEMNWVIVKSDLLSYNDTLHSAIVPTFFDSTKSNGIFHSVFQVVAHGVTPDILTVSFPDSGYSVDNLPPLAPVNANIQPGGNNSWIVSWRPSIGQHGDFRNYVIYRSTVAGFLPSPSNRLAAVYDALFVDFTATPGIRYFYSITSIDYSGNESLPASIVTDAAEERWTIPGKNALQANYPNPFNPTTAIGFELAALSDVTLRVFDILGREVAVLVNGQMPPGLYTATWDATDLPSGIYFYRLTAGSFTETRKMQLAK